ncbi:S-adenosyl-L-methionine-dependent methyltransferase [Backusella circina FSU 941]|nr:S-adenosyl-L-methionine-dependent methyltransferase [Backusella circina FSU 941]
MAQKDNWSASNYSKHASFVPKLGNVILDILDPKSDERILDFGCGDGPLTENLAKRCKSVVGIDASQDMISRAKQDSTSDTEYYVVNGFDLDTWFDEQKLEPFDAVFSSATLHWLKKDPAKAIRNMHHVLKSGGRMVIEMGGYLNVLDVHAALIHALDKRGLDGKSYSPWFFPSSEYYSKLLEENGFKVEYAELVPRQTQLNTDVAGWIETFGFAFLEPFDDKERKVIVKEIQDYLQYTNQREDGTWSVFYNRLRVVAIKQ